MKFDVYQADYPGALKQFAAALHATGRPLLLYTGINGFGFMISWATAAPVVVEASTNLANPKWSRVGTALLTGGSAYFSDPQWTNYSRRFYRIRSF